MADVYDKCPTYESAHFLLRLVEMDDAEDLLECYSDPKAQPLFNADNCNSDFCFSSLDEMRGYLEWWLEAYKNKWLFRFSIVDKQSNRAVGTVEIFGGERGVLRIDIKPGYEKEAYMNELLKMADAFFGDFQTDAIVTKAVPEASGRVKALLKNGYGPYEAKHEHY